VLPGLRRETVDVHEPDDLAGVGVDVGDHHAAVGVGGEHDRPVDRPDQVAERGGVGGDAAQRVCHRDHQVARVEQRIDDAVPARRLGGAAVDENDGGLHEKLLSGWGLGLIDGCVRRAWGRRSGRRPAAISASRQSRLRRRTVHAYEQEQARTHAEAPASQYGRERRRSVCHAARISRPGSVRIGQDASLGASRRARQGRGGAESTAGEQRRDEAAQEARCDPQEDQADHARGM
jgi:hypothetical protein